MGTARQLDPKQFNKVEIIFSEEPERAVKAYDLSYYLYHVKALYTFLYQTDNIDIKNMLIDIHNDVVQKSAYVDKKTCSNIL